jgi:outer membrane lipoprotein-sorting protein
MRSMLMFTLILFATGCQAQMQKWQRERTVEHLSRLKNYHGHATWAIAGETSETEIWFETPNHFFAISKNGEVIRSDGSTMEVYDPRTKFYSVFRHLPPVKESDNQQLIQDLFDQSMKAFTFTFGPIGRVAGRGTIELRAKPKENSVIESEQSQILDEYSFPLKSVVTFKTGPVAKYEFTDIAINEKFELPKAKIPSGALKLEWDFNASSPPDKERAVQFQNLKFEKSLKRETGEVLNYYRNGAQFVSVIRYKNFGVTPVRGIPVKIGARNGFLLPGPVSNMLTVSEGGTTSLYSSNLLVDDLIAFASFGS